MDFILAILFEIAKFNLDLFNNLTTRFGALPLSIFTSFIILFIVSLLVILTCRLFRNVCRKFEYLRTFSWYFSIITTSTLYAFNNVTQHRFYSSYNPVQQYMLKFIHGGGRFFIVCAIGIFFLGMDQDLGGGKRTLLYIEAVSENRILREYFNERSSPVKPGLALIAAIFWLEGKAMFKGFKRFKNDITLFFGFLAPIIGGYLRILLKDGPLLIRKTIIYTVNCAFEYVDSHWPLFAVAFTYVCKVLGPILLDLVHRFVLKPLIWFYVNVVRVACLACFEFTKILFWSGLTVTLSAVQAFVFYIHACFQVCQLRSIGVLKCLAICVVGVNYTIYIPAYLLISIFYRPKLLDPILISARVSQNSLQWNAHRLAVQQLGHSRDSTDPTHIDEIVLATPPATDDTASPIERSIDIIDDDLASLPAVEEIILAPESLPNTDLVKHFLAKVEIAHNAVAAVTGFDTRFSASQSVSVFPGSINESAEIPKHKKSVKAFFRNMSPKHIRAVVEEKKLRKLEIGRVSRSGSGIVKDKKEFSFKKVFKGIKSIGKNKVDKEEGFGYVPPSRERSDRIRALPVEPIGEGMKVMYEGRHTPARIHPSFGLGGVNRSQ